MVSTKVTSTAEKLQSEVNSEESRTRKGAIVLINVPEWSGVTAIKMEKLNVRNNYINLRRRKEEFPIYNHKLWIKKIISGTFGLNGVVDSCLGHYSELRRTSPEGRGMEYCIRTQRRNKWPDGGYKCTVNRETEKAAEEKTEKKKKGTREQEKVSGIERKGTDSEECRQLKISAEWSVITERGRQTASFFCFFPTAK